jgi:5-formyltetrahydrofolate cyclo-ligase
MASLASQGARLCLPVMQGRERPLLFRAWAPGDHLDTRAWGIREPAADQPTRVPDFMLVPLLAVDRTGNRLGYGAGFYDCSIRAIRTASHSVVTIGLAFDEQIIDAVPHSDYDVPLDYVLTPSELIQCQGAA